MRWRMYMEIHLREPWRVRRGKTSQNEQCLRPKIGWKSQTNVKKNILSKEESTWDGPEARENMVPLRNRKEFAEHREMGRAVRNERKTGTRLCRALLRILDSTPWATRSHQRHLVGPFNLTTSQPRGCGHVRAHSGARSFQGAELRCRRITFFGKFGSKMEMQSAKWGLALRSGSGRAGAAQGPVNRTREKPKRQT